MHLYKSWCHSGFKVLGFFLGMPSYLAKNWEGISEEVEVAMAPAQHLLWPGPGHQQHGSFNSVAQVCHPGATTYPAQKAPEVALWTSGTSHSVQQAVFYLHCNDRGQGLVNLVSKVAAFHLQALQHLLFIASPLAMAGLWSCALTRGPQPSLGTFSVGC